MTATIAPETDVDVGRHDLPVATGLRLRPRRPARALLAVLLVVASVAASLTIYLRIGNREAVLAATRTVLAGEQLTRSDFRVVSISTDDQLATVPAVDLDGLVGQYARVRIVGGSLVVDEMVQRKPLVSADRVLMAVSVPVGGVPVGVREGSRIVLIVSPGGDRAGDTEPIMIDATVAAVPSNLADLVSGSATSSEIALSVEVPPERAAVVGLADDVAIGVLDPSAMFPSSQESR